MFARNPTSSRNFFFWGEGNVFQWKKKVFTSSPPPSEYEMRVGHFFFALFYFIFYFCLFGSPARARRFRFRRRNGANRNQFGERFLFFILFFFICFFSKKKNERKKNNSAARPTRIHTGRFRRYYLLVSSRFPFFFFFLGGRAKEKCDGQKLSENWDWS